MQKKYLIALLTMIFFLGFSLEADAQRGKKKRGTKERPAKVDETETESSSSRSTGSQRSNRDEEDKSDIWTFSKDRLSYEFLGYLRGVNFGANNGINFLLKPGVSYKLLDWLHFGVSPKISYYFVSIPGAEDVGFLDYGGSFFSRIVLFDQFYIQGGYDVNNVTALLPTDRREWYAGPMIGGGIARGFGDWRYTAQIMFELDEELREYDAVPIELWFGFTFNL